MSQKKSVFGVAVFFLLVTLIVAYGAFAAEVGENKSDPLVTLSYLEGLTPDFEKTIGQVVSDMTDEPLRNIEAQITQLSRDFVDMQAAGGADISGLAANEEFIAAVAALVPAGSAAGGGGDGYARLELEAGTTVTLDMGALFFLRVGSAVCVAPGDPGLINLTTAAEVPNGGRIEPNHVYTATIGNERGFRAEDSVTVFIMGRYTAE